MSIKLVFKSILSYYYLISLIYCIIINIINEVSIQNWIIIYIQNTDFYTKLNSLPFFFGVGGGVKRDRHNHLSKITNKMEVKYN